ncbi:hypothetical protein B0I29_13327 [Actinoplanes lutulentus]|uniref:Uncharacterized protein n=1 Tax=Actinoplanes lutulentus TaxID=1287878 RepID=A0A327YW56_9ACTN|nr:hypothetical protein B0I29_13327 [Actinoplanes lutulentus]
MRRLGDEQDRRQRYFVRRNPSQLVEISHVVFVQDSAALQKQSFNPTKRVFEAVSNVDARPLANDALGET